LEDEAEGGDYDGPEVDSAVAFESYVYEDEKFNTHPVCNGAEGGDECKCYGARRCLAGVKVNRGELVLLPSQPAWSCKCPTIVRKGNKLHAFVVLHNRCSRRLGVGMLAYLKEKY